MSGDVTNCHAASRLHLLRWNPDGRLGIDQQRGESGSAGAAAPVAFAGIVGTGLAIAATRNRRAYYDDYYGGPYSYGGYGPGYGYYVPCW